MHNASIQVESFRDVTVVAVCTAGVETNAGRVGDPATVVETEQGFEKLAGGENQAQQESRTVHNACQGTINTMVFISRPLTSGALVRTVVTATEAKTAALQELAVNSRYSDGLATGTGTDQIGVAAVKDDGRRPLTSAGKHVKLGELIGRTVLAAVKQALALQNGLTPAGQCSAGIHLQRLGCNRRQMADTTAGFLERDKAVLLRHNFTAIERDPVTVAAVAAMVHLLDKFAWQVLPSSCWSEIMGSYAAQVACAVCGDYDKMEEFRGQLAPLPEENGNQDFVRLVCRAMALGFDAKWEMK
jgi:adenosylcobinamide amidohydrolase